MKLEFTSEFLGVVVEFRTAFSKRSWPYMLAVTLPWLLQQGQRTVRSFTTGAGLAVHESNFYRFFSEFKFNTELLSRILFDRIVSTFELSEILLVVDDTLCPKWGRRIFGTASFFDHVGRPRPGFIWGHNWVVLAVIVDLFGAPVAIPFWVKLYRSQPSCPPKEFRTRLQITEEAIRRVKTWTSLRVQVVADGAYNNESLLTPLAELGVALVSRLRNDARLRADPPKVDNRGRGRRPKYGPWLSRLPHLANNPKGWHKPRFLHVRQGRHRQGEELRGMVAQIGREASRRHRSRPRRQEKAMLFVVDGSEHDTEADHRDLCQEMVD